MNWHELNKALPDMSEEEVKYLMQLERRRVEPRVTFLVRLHQRFCALRDARERQELLEGIQG